MALIVITTIYNPVLGIVLAIFYIINMTIIRDDKEIFYLEHLDIQDQQQEDEDIMQQAYATYVKDSEENQRRAKRESDEIYSVNTVANNSLPIMPGEGYNTVPSNRLRQVMNISGDRYK